MCRRLLYTALEKLAVFALSQKTLEEDIANHSWHAVRPVHSDALWSMRYLLGLGDASFAANKAREQA